MSKYKAIIFDMDGTLFDTEKIARLCWHDVSDYFKVPIPEAFKQAVTGITMARVPLIWKEYMPADLDMYEVFNKLRYYAKEYKLKHGPLPKADLHKLFDFLQQKGLKIALCSSSRRETIDFNLDYVHIKERFDVIVDGEMTNNGKPAPDIYLLTAKLLHVDPSECLVVEDSRNGIISGHAAGMDVLMAVDLIEPDDELKALTIKTINHLDELKEIV